MKRVGFLPTVPMSCWNEKLLLEKEHCKFYSNADMLLIVTAAMEFVTWHVTYFRDLRIYIRSIEDKVAVAAIQYGTDIPEQYQSAPLKAMLAAQNT